MFARRALTLSRRAFPGLHGAGAQFAKPVGMQTVARRSFSYSPGYFNENFFWKYANIGPVFLAILFA